MTPDIKRWFEREGERFFTGIGLKPDDIVLDFGCGEGVYSIPAAKLVGIGGAVYALDQNRHSLRVVIKKAASFGILNIVTVHDLDELKRVLHGTLLDAVLFYDVIHSYYFTRIEIMHLLMSICPMVRAGGLISVYPRHMEQNETNEVIMELKKLGFFPSGEKSTNLIHDFTYTGGYVLQFEKTKGSRNAEN
ncbi:MAG: methyltransferase domain-containing protein [Spirochaetes bacterium]|nr:methyltransferase domain-containing protein [Spirochaetota bacterium]